MTNSYLIELPETWGKDIAEIMDRAIDNAIAPLKSKIRTLEEQIGRTMLHEAKIFELEQRPALKFAGTWADHKDFDAGNLVTHQGGLWYCKEQTKDRPGQSSKYQLVVKSGRAPT